MRSSQSLLPLLLLAVGAVALGVALFGNRAEEAVEAEPLLPTAADARRASERGARSSRALVPPPEVVVTSEAPAITTVLWPVKIELDILQADYLPAEKGVSAIGSGATARLTGRITGPDDRGARAEVRFMAGANTGRVLHTDATGRFGAADLYPGLAVVEVRGEGLLGSRREVRLRERRQTHLNIGYGRPGGLHGRVQDAQGEGLEGASVLVDGTRVVTGADGGFYLSSVAAGQVLVEVECPGFAAYKELVPITGGKILPVEQATFTLRKGASLTIVVPNQVGGPGPVQVVLLPSQIERPSDLSKVQRSTGFPWHLINPIDVWPGRPETVEGLPGKVVRMYAFRAGATVPQKVITLREGRAKTVTLTLAPAPKVVGRVREDGKPVAGARVRLEAPDRVRATLRYFKEQSYFLESAVMPELPAAVQEVVTNEEGRFTFTAWEGAAGVRYLEAVGPDHESWAGRLVHPGEEVIDLDLAPIAIAGSSLSISFPGRWQALPIEILIDGQPFDPVVLPFDEDLPIEGLRAGRWRLEVTWNGDPIHLDESFGIEGATQLELSLPVEAIEGQNEEQWTRAGKVYPR